MEPVEITGVQILLTLHQTIFNRFSDSMSLSLPCFWNQRLWYWSAFQKPEFSSRASAANLRKMWLNATIYQQSAYQVPSSQILENLSTIITQVWSNSFVSGSRNPGIFLGGIHSITIKIFMAQTYPRNSILRCGDSITGIQRYTLTDRQSVIMYKVVKEARSTQ